MKDELDQQLVSRYPKIFRDRYADMTQTCMCWGFECNDGWYNIINQLCSCIQGHIDWKEQCHNADLEYNNLIEAARAGDLVPIQDHYRSFANSEEIIKQALELGPRKVANLVPQVVAEQVKEKFGGLRFYYHGGDDVVDGMVRMAEALSEVTCEECGAPGTPNSQGWIRTLCQQHAEEREQRKQEQA